MGRWRLLWNSLLEWFGFGVVVSRKLVIMPETVVLLPSSWAFPSHSGLLSAQAFVSCDNWHMLPYLSLQNLPVCPFLCLPISQILESSSILG